MTACQPQIRRRHAKSPDNWSEISGPEPRINFRNKPWKFFRISLRQASEDNDRPGPAGLFPLNRMENRIYGLFLCISNKAAGVQQDTIHGDILIRLRDTVDCRPPSFLAVITGRGMAHTRPDGIHVIPIGCLRE